MTEVQVNTPELRATSRHLERIAGAVAQARIDASIESLPAALTGTTSASAARALARTWSVRLTRLREEAASQGDTVHDSARAYDNTDAEVSSRQRALLRGASGSPGLRTV